MLTGTPTLAEVIQLAMESRLADVHVALPGKVEAYDAAAQVADVRPMVRRLVPAGTSESGDVQEDLPVIPNVPVLHPSGGGFAIHFPVQVGDTVLLVFNESDPVGWRRTGEVTNPPDQRSHSLAHAVALLGYRTASNAIPGTSGSNLTLANEGGLTVTLTPTQLQVGGSADAAALASKVNAIVNAIVNTTIVPGDGGAAIKAAVTAAWTAAGNTSVSAVLKVGS